MIVITGGTGLIGSEIVRELPGFGANVVVGVRNTEKFKDLSDQIDIADKNLIPECYKLDVSIPQSIKEFFQKVEKKYGRIDVLINNAFPKTKDWSACFEDVKAESLFNNLCSHAGGYFLCCQEATRYMKKCNEGVILNVGSIYGTVGPHFPIYEKTPMTTPGAYALIKGGIHSFTKYLSTYLAPYNIRVNCLSPGGLLDESLQYQPFIKNYKKNTPLGRMGEPKDLVGPMVFLISDASRYITGVVLHVDGGWTAW